MLAFAIINFMNFSKDDLLSECTYKASRSSGKGGQHVNKTESRISLFFDLNNSEVLNDLQISQLKEFLANRLSKDGVLQIDVESERSQLQNKKTAQNKLLKLLAKGLEKKKKRKATKPTKAAIRKRLKAKKRQAKKKENRKKDFL